MADNRQPQFTAPRGVYYGGTPRPYTGSMNMGNMRYGGAANYTTARIQQGVPAPLHQPGPAAGEAPPTPALPGTKPPEPAEKAPSGLLQSLGLDDEKLILLAVILILVKSGADWPLLAALFYIMM